VDPGFVRGFAPLRTHSYFSLLDGGFSPEDLVRAAVEAGYAALGLTDRHSLAGAVRFLKAAQAAGVHGVIGAEVELANEKPVTLLVENENGYRNLCRLLSLETALGYEDLARYAGGLICLWGPEAGPGWEPVREIYGRNFAFALGAANGAEQRQSRLLLQAARKGKIPAVAAPAVHYEKPADHLRWEILQSMRTLTLLGQEHKEKKPAGQYHLLRPEEVAQVWGAVAPQAIANARAIAERCQFRFTLGDITFPRYECERPVQEELRALAEEGVRWRYGEKPRAEVRERLERELGVIAQVGYSEYFLIFADLVRWAKSRGIATLARGSAAGSLVCYVLGIGNICPFRFNLCFERFLNKERMQFQKLADIDLDLPWDQREEAVQYIFQKYGEEHTAMIGAYNTFQGRAAIADIAKVYGIPEREVRRFTENIPYFSGDAVMAVQTNPECAHLPVHEEPYKTVLELAGSFDGFPRHATMHPCGLVIANTPLADRLPLFRSAKQLRTTQYAMDEVEELGLLKMDLLGQAGLSVLREARENIRVNTSAEPPAVQEEDEAVWRAISQGDTRGVFHIESPNMVNLLVLTNCRDIDCLTALESVIRPGAANEGRKGQYARRHQGLEPVTYAHPSLEPLLRETYGLLVYEEHILLVAHGFAGLDWGRADTLRRLLVKNKDHARIEALGEEFRAAAAKRGYRAEEIDAVWNMLREFAGYMFNKAHSAAYAVEAYEGAYLKYKYPVEFLASVLTNRRGFYAPIVYVLEALRYGAGFLPPCLEKSSRDKFLPQGKQIRLPLNQVKGLSESTLERIVSGRPFFEVGDFFRRVEPAQNEWLALLKTGALDCFGEPRGRLFWRLSRLAAYSQTAAHSLFAPEDPDLSTDGEKLRWEAEYLGFPVSAHPLDYYGAGLDWPRFTSAEELREHPEKYFGKKVEIAGMIVADRIHPTPRGPMKFLTLADRTGFLEVSLFAEAYRHYGHLTVRPLVAVTALAEPFDNQRGVMLNAEAVWVPGRGSYWGRSA
jgi:DNA-directed DNA polymerase III PolC